MALPSGGGTACLAFFGTRVVALPSGGGTAGLAFVGGRAFVGTATGVMGLSGGGTAGLALFPTGVVGLKSDGGAFLVNVIFAIASMGTSGSGGGGANEGALDQTPAAALVLRIQSCIRQRHTHTSNLDPSHAWGLSV